MTRAAATRQAWLEAIERHRHDRDAAGSADYWSPRLDTASRDELRAIQDDKIAAVAPFLYENSDFYRRRFDRLGLLPTDLCTVDDLVARWPIVDKHEMAEDAAAHPPYGTYTAMNDEIWAERGWMMFSSSGTTGAPRVFRYSHIDRELRAWANARAPIHGLPPGRHRFHDHRLRPACLGLGRAIRARQDGTADPSGRRHGCMGARQYRDPL
jgi:phenylacetate-CoA ligase